MTTEFLPYRDVILRPDGVIAYSEPYSNWSGLKVVRRVPGAKREQIQVDAVISYRDPSRLNPVQIEKIGKVPCRHLRDDLFEVDLSSVDPRIQETMVSAWVEFE